MALKVGPSWAVGARFLGAASGSPTKGRLVHSLRPRQPLDVAFWILRICVPFPLCIGFGARRVQFPYLWVRRRLYSKTNGPLVQ